MRATLLSALAVSAVFGGTFLILERARSVAAWTTPTSVIDLPPGAKLVSAYKTSGEHIWHLTRPARPGEMPETYRLTEVAVMPETIDIREHIAVESPRGLVNAEMDAGAPDADGTAAEAEARDGGATDALRREVRMHIGDVVVSLPIRLED